MSYILDALKKSEKERRRGSIPDPLTIQEAVPQMHRKRIFWPYLIIAALALNAAVFAVWYGLFHPKPVLIIKSVSGRPESNIEKKPPPYSTGKDEGSRVTKEIAGSEAIVSNNERSINREKALKPGTDIKKKAQDRNKTSVEATRDRAGPPRASVETPGTDAPNEPGHHNFPPPVPNRLYNLSELPLSVRQNLPDFSVSVFLYSDDVASRLVRINGAMMKEGQYLNPGLKLEEIIPAGVVFSYQNYRFLVGPK